MTNIILLTVDCLRADFLGCYGNKEYLTPNLDKFAKEGILFSQAISNGPSTPFSFPSIFTSTYALMDSNFPKMSASRISLPEILKEKGYRTAGFNSNPYLSNFYKYSRFFEYFYDSIAEDTRTDKKSSRVVGFIKKHKFLKTIVKKLLNLFSIEYKLDLPYKRADEINQKALNWLKQTNGKFFIWIHYMDTHHPFIPSGEYRKVSYRKLIKLEEMLTKNPSKISRKKINKLKTIYKAVIRYTDNELGLLFDRLRQMNLYDNSLIIITADHGEEFKEHGDFNHLAKLYEELIHVPLLLRGPNLPKDQHIETLISLIDLSPTILDYLNYDREPRFQGLSLLPLIEKKHDLYNRRGVISETIAKDGKVNLSLDEGSRVISYRTSDWKLIINYETNIKSLFDLKSDPKETINLYNKYQDKASEFEKILRAHIEIEKEIHKKDKERGLIDQIAKKIKF